ncbi:IS1595 family transposase [Glaesserella parasuis]|nr:IS1595 family transposase [Glaesserella parasuis]MDP0118525.1 IS1595 family transposase [Glaesserella parasuis]
MRKSRLSQHKQNKLIELFVAGVTARTTAELVNVNKITAAYYFYRLRLLIYQNSPHMEMFEGEIEADESYFGGTRKGKRGRGAVGKTAVFGLLKRDGKVYTVVVPNTQSATLLPIIREKVKPDRIVYTDFYRSYDVLDVSEFNHFRINHSNLKSQISILKQLVKGSLSWLSRTAPRFIYLIHQYRCVNFMWWQL